MKKTLPWYFVLTLLLIMGAFASMALNAYGVVLMGYVALGFALVLLFELLHVLRTTRAIADKGLISGELTALICLCIIYFLQVMGFEMKYDQVITTVLYVALIVFNVFFFANVLGTLKDKPGKIRFAVSLYFIAVFAVWIGAYFFRFQPVAGIYFAIAAAISLAGFIVVGWWKGDVTVDGEKTNAISIVTGFRNKAGLELAIVGLTVLYFSLSAANILPPLYVGTQPSGYAKVVRKSVNNDPAAVAKFEDAYRKFLKGK